ncbi:MAG: CocE/NonD family hydrolase [Candidatus Korobacteraceae bacterium]
MFTREWSTSARAHKVQVERGVKVLVTDGVRLNADVFRPQSENRFPAILGYFPYDMAMQSAPITVTSFQSVQFKNPGQEKANASIEAGDPYFYARRGYAHVLVNVRGTGKSEGSYGYLSPQEQQDGHDVVEWIAAQPWCDGNVGMFGASYFAIVQQFVAATHPPHLKCLFAPWAATDMYRDRVYHGGILSYRFVRNWSASELSEPRIESYCLKVWGREKYQEEIARLLEDEDIAGTPDLAAALRNPTEQNNTLLVDYLLLACYGPYWEDRRVRFDQVQVPVYLGGCWGHVGLHLPGALRSWENLRGPKKTLIGPPAYLDRPLAQMQYESLRWFDYWLKGIENGIMQEPSVRLYKIGTHEWTASSDWPLPETRWTPFYLHENGVMNEHDYRTNEGSTSYEDSPWSRGAVKFYTPPMAENTDVIGPAVLNLHASTTAVDVFLFASLWKVDAEGNERLLTRGWLKGSHRELDPDLSKPWLPVHSHRQPSPLESGQVYEFHIPIVPTATVFKAGERILLKICGADDKPTNSMEAIGVGHLSRQSASRITVYHNDDNPSHLVLPITEGNYLGTFARGAQPYVL